MAAARRLLPAIGVFGWLVVPVSLASCNRPSTAITTSESSTLRVGVGGIPQDKADAGVRGIVGNLALEGLIGMNEDGRARPFLAESWTIAPDGLSLTIQLRPNAKFQDGSPVTASVISQVLQSVLPAQLGPVFEDIAGISAAGDRQVLIRLRQPSRFVLEALDTTLRKPGKTPVGTGAFVPAEGTASALRANGDYYLGRPPIDRIVISSYPTVRTAWAELLRGNLDMLYEVNVDALDSLQGSSNVAVFSFLRHYQYLIMFNPNAQALQSPAIRRELNAAIDRDAIVRAALNGHGTPAIGPVSPRHWAFDASAKRLAFDPALAKSLASRHLTFTCLVPADSVYERMALAIKQQLAAASVDMRVVEAPQEQVAAAAANNNYETLLGDLITGPSLFRSYRRWSSKMQINPRPMASAGIDAALDRIRHARTDDEYRAGVSAFQQAVVDDPPAMFLAWGERARAVSRRFDVPAPENARDVLATLRLWRPATGLQAASTN